MKINFDKIKKVITKMSLLKSLSRFKKIRKRKKTCL